MQVKTEAGEGDIVRPFIITGGRTPLMGARLRMETVVTATPPALSAPLGFEQAHIVQLCRRPLSLAELAAALAVPIGVARELVADLIAEGLLVTHAQVVDDQPALELLARVHKGIREL
ncbi:MAG TPA: DUF742 domain-containing protein [Thermopolyspora sp.]